MTPKAIKTREWEIHLMEMFDQWIGRRMEWGTIDCATLCCASFDAQTGEDLTGELKGVFVYNNTSGALKTQNKISVISYLKSRGVEEVPEGFHQRGDFLLFDTEDILLGCGICDGTCAIIIHEDIVSKIALVLLPPIRAAYRIGHK